MKRLSFYLILIVTLLTLLPLKGEFRYSNVVNEFMFLGHEDRLAVTFPWGGVLIKSSIEEAMLSEVVNHELCHVDQVNLLGWYDFMIESHTNPHILEYYCWRE